jgi:hypothetical protein
MYVRCAMQVFKSKTGNAWDQRSNFAKVPKKYVLVNLARQEFVTDEVLQPLPKARHGQYPTVTADAKADAKKAQRDRVLARAPRPYVSSGLSKPVRKTVRMLTDVSMLQNAVRGSGVAMPLGRLERSALAQASHVLAQIKCSLEELTVLKSPADGVIDAEAVRTKYEEVAQLSSQFYELIPHVEYNNQPISPFSNMEELKLKSDMLQSLENVHLGARLVMGAEAHPELHPVDYCFQALDISLEELATGTDDDEIHALRQYIAASATGQGVHVEQIYRLQRKGEAERIQAW